MAVTYVCCYYRQLFHDPSPSGNHALFVIARHSICRHVTSPRICCCPASFSLDNLPHVHSRPLRYRYALFLKPPIFNLGWSWGRQGDVAGTVGLAMKTDAFTVFGFNFPVEYRCHFQNHGWLDWVPADKHHYSSGNTARLEAIEFRFPQGIPKGTSFYGRVHLQESGWGSIVRIENGTVLGTVGESRRLEAIQLVAGDNSIISDDALIKDLNDSLASYSQGITVNEPCSRMRAAPPEVCPWRRHFWLHAIGCDHQGKNQ